jgi:hypothetical protein
VGVVGMGARVVRVEHLNLRNVPLNAKLAISVGQVLGGERIVFAKTLGRINTCHIADCIDFSTLLQTNCSFLKVLSTKPEQSNLFIEIF